MKLLSSILATAAALTCFVLPAQAAGDIDLCVSTGRTAGFTGETLVVAVAVGMAESRCDPSARYVNSDSHNSVDRGLWQINDYWHPEVSDTCAYNAQCNANAARKIYDQADGWTPWSTYKSGRYKQFVDDARAAIGAPPAPVLAAKSINGDKYDDALGVDPSGNAWIYRGKAGGGFGTGTKLGPGWGGFTRIGIGDSNADGWADLWAIGNGSLYYWHNRGDGTFTSAATVDTGWAAMENVAFGDVNGDNRTDILARDGGKMYLYVGKGNGKFAERDLVSAGWASLFRHTAADADGDGDGDVWATSSAGELFFWKRSGADFATAVQVGSGWNGFRQMTSMDVNGDNRADLVAVRTSDNTLWQWLGTGTGGFGTGTQIGSGWTGWDLAAN
ncbi:FG-GAP-like repeat-containing protein [Lentzea sp. NBC_00516]|uniref:FG-GAP-like repeat-containing protein n=1 Tax=Lentzea sp. NBC_00516 TaxID=2903582 RepID=UPI002E81D64D|nr:FG-GAP-like repeat-containing protein [Lentzea sp. NBC_00516]WUD28919.1 FG-GAP-like repeat-containing protein [Lentzea sp. NBC_00516]